LKLGERLTDLFGVPVRVENNIRAYTLFVLSQLRETSFLVVSVRNGIGAGIVSRGRLHRGETGLAGEIGHITIDAAGRQCRCGKQGCLETIVNQRLLCEKYRVATGTLTSGCEEDVASDDCLRELFTAAHQGAQAALTILEEAAIPLGRSLATLLLVLDIQSIYLVGRFGQHGAVWIDSLQREIQRNVDPGLSFSVHYRPLDDDGYLLGAASLVARDYLDYSILAAPEVSTRRR
jgi:N-acetylglucosamine repressor